MTSKRAPDLLSSSYDSTAPSYQLKVEFSAQILRMGPEATTSVPELDIRETTSIRQDLTEILGVVHELKEKLNQVKESEDRIERMMKVESEESEPPLEVSDEEVEHMTRDYIRGRDIFYPSDVAYDLNLDYNQVCRVIAKMKHEGALGDVD